MHRIAYTIITGSLLLLIPVIGFAQQQKKEIEEVKYIYSIGAEEYPNPEYNFEKNFRLKSAGDINGDGHPDFFYKTVGVGNDLTEELHEKITKTIFLYGGGPLTEENSSLVRQNFDWFYDITGDGYSEGFRVEDRMFSVILNEKGDFEGKIKKELLEYDSSVKIRPCADLNNDGYQDLIAFGDEVDVNNAHLTVIYGAQNINDISFQEHEIPFNGDIDSSIELEYRFDSFGCADIDADESIEIIQLTSGQNTMYTPNYSNVWYILEYELNQANELHPTDSVNISSSVRQSTRISRKDFDLIDFNGDGFKELIVSMYTGNGTYLFTKQEEGDFYDSTYTQRFDDYITVGDFDGDGYNDLINLNRDASASLMMGDPNLEFSDGSDIDKYTYDRTLFDAYNKPAEYEIGDVDGDGLDDFILTYYEQDPEGRFLSNGFELFFGNEQRSVDNPHDVNYAFPQYQKEYPIHSINLGDINEDGIQDYGILFNSNTEETKLNIFYGGNLSKETPDLVIQHPEKYKLDTPVVGDFNGDGAPDIAMHYYYDDYKSGLNIYHGGEEFDNTADYTLLYSSFAEESWYRDDFYNPLANVGDLNMDGADDLIFHISSTAYNPPFDKTTYILFGGEDISDTPNIEMPLAGLQFVPIEDFNGDGRNDLAISEGYNVLVYSAFNEAEGEEFNSEPFFQVEKERYFYSDSLNRELTYFGFMMDTGDFNGDNKPDLVVSATDHSNLDDLSNPVDAVYFYFGWDGESDSPEEASFPLRSEYFAGHEYYFDYEYLAGRNGELTTVKDLNNDGADEILVGTGPIIASEGPQTNAVIYYGDPNIDEIGVQPDMILTGPNQSKGLGTYYISKHSAIGDFDGDEKTDFILTQESDFNYVHSPFYVFQPGKTGVSNESESVAFSSSFKLHQNYPNPFNPTTKISYDLPASGDVKLQIFDITGRLVSTVVDQRQTAGVHSAKFDASNLASGVYIYRLQTASFTQTRRMMLIK